MDTIWLRDFEALAESGNFSRAAEARHVTQPAFSRRIRALEDWAGAPLFDRDAKPIALTEAGGRLRPFFADIVRRLDEAREEAGAIATGTLRFAATHALSFSFLPAWLRRLEPDLPQAAIHLVSDGLEACERLMLAGRAEFLICHHHEAAPSPLGPPRFTSRIVGRDRLRLLGAPSTPGKPRYRADDAKAPRLSYGSGSGLGRILAALRTQPERPIFTSHLAATLRGMALSGSGLAWLPESLVETDLDAGTLVPAGDGAESIPLQIRIFRASAQGTRTGQRFWNAIPPEPIETNQARPS